MPGKKRKRADHKEQTPPSAPSAAAVRYALLSGVQSPSPDKKSEKAAKKDNVTEAEAIREGKKQGEKKAYEVGQIIDDILNVTKKAWQPFAEPFAKNYKQAFIAKLTSLVQLTKQQAERDTLQLFKNPGVAF